MGGKTVAPGGTFTYRVDVDNEGPSPVEGAGITDTLPDGLTYVSGDRCSSTDGKTVTCGAVDFDPVDSRYWDFQVQVHPGYTGNGDDLKSVVTPTSNTDGEKKASDPVGPHIAARTHRSR